jgi:thiopeptide-type bacteriocin biosynthesis protein
MGILATVRKPIRHDRRRQRLDGADFEPEDVFLLRSPLLPIDELDAWGAGLRGPEAIGNRAALESAIDADRIELRGWLRDLLSRPVVIEALYLATPALLEALDEWRRDPDSKKGRRAEETLVRYAIRMTARPTPFGMFAGCTVGHVGTRNRLSLAARSEYRRHSRLDMGYLFSLAEELNQDRELRRWLTHRPNSSLYRAAGRLRYAEARYDGPSVNYHLVAVEPEEFLDAALAQAKDGSTPDEIAAAVAASDPDGEISLEDAAAYVGELIDSQLLVSDLWPAVTGPEAVHGLIETLARFPTPAARAAADRLRRANEALEELDRKGLGNDPERYEEIIRALEPLPKRADRRRLFQVDLFKPGEVSLDPTVMDEIARGIEALHRLEPPALADELGGFRDRFVERYGMQRLVPLVEALDAEAGVGKPLAGIGGDTAPLLDGLDLSPVQEPEKVAWGPREELLLRKLMQVRAAGASEIVLDDGDLKSLETPKRPPLPDSFLAMASLGAADEEALAAGNFLVRVSSVFGPSGARLSGRFCHGDPRISRAVLEELRREEGLDPDAVFAEVVHVGAGRIANINSRPVLRDWEIAYLGASGAPRERQIPIDDLLVTVEGFEVILYSARLGRRVQPRLTSAHNFSFGSLAVYRFLCSLQGQGVRSGLHWDWRPFAMQPFLPRVRYGRAILRRACWNVTAEEIKDLAGRRDADRYAAARCWRESRGIPRRVVLADEVAELLVDFDNIISLDTFLATVQTRTETTELEELWQGTNEQPVRGPEGRFVQDLTVSFGRHRTPTRRSAPSLSMEGERILPPTSRWLYLKLYTGSATADLVLRDAVAPLVSRAMESGAADRWFFVRYADPQNHLRIRFGGEPARLSEIIGLLPELLDPLLREGRITRWQLDTYEREVERYGGPAGIDIAEGIFHADSEAVLTVVDDLAGDRGADWRWRAALAGIDRLLDDFGFDLTARRDVMANQRRSFGAEFKAGPLLTQQFAKRLRETGDELYDLLTARELGRDHPLANTFAAFDRRSEKVAPLATELRALHARGALTAPVEDLVTSYIHMFVNRLIRTDARAHELVLYDLLHRLTVSRLVRAGAAPAEPTPPETDPTPAPMN